jgi:hypothetical protein
MPLHHLHGTSLAGRPHRFPEDLPETPVALVFGFAHEARLDVRAWKEALAAAALPFLSCPATVDDLPARALAGVAEAMKAHVPEAGWDGIVSIHKGGRALLKEMHWHPDAHAKVIVSDRSGRILASHGSGPFSEAAFNALRAAFGG